MIDIPKELWMLEATPDDPREQPFFYGLGGAQLIATSKDEAERLAAKLGPAAMVNGISRLEAVQVK